MKVPKLNKYKKKNREETWEEYDDEADPKHESPIVKSRMRDLYELILPDRIIRSPDLMALHRRDLDAEWEEKE